MAYKKIEQYDEKVTSGLMGNYKEVLDLLGENSDREGLLKTPERLAKAMQYLRGISWMQSPSLTQLNFMSR
jgi:GTP cyclohydrolase IA